MKTAPVIIWGCVAFACCGCSLAPPETRVNEIEVSDATDKALLEIDDFIAELSVPSGKHHSVKVPIKEDGVVEHFWLVDVAYSEGKFQGTINNDPGVISGVTLGQNWEVGKFEIVDWMYMRDGKMYGNYTLRPILKTLPQGDAAAIRNLMAEP